MPRLKRTRDDAALDTPSEPEVAPELSDTVLKLRNMWEFASLMQYIFMFGDSVKVDKDLDIEDLEAECLSPTPSPKLAEIGLSLLKFVSSHRGLTPEIFDEYTRRQYLAKAPQHNPFGDEEEPTKFHDLDVFTRIRVLHQLSVWTLGNPDRIRTLMPQDEDNTDWRMEPLGWDKEDRAYFVLDDNRLYRRTDEPPPPPSPKVKAKSKATKKARSRGTRASKRRRIADSSDDEDDLAANEAVDVDDTQVTADVTQDDEELGFGFTSKTWECVAVTLAEYQEFMSDIFRSRDPNEKQLRKRLEEDVIPIIEKRAEALRQKQLKKMRDLENLQKLATAKRSSRLADKAEREKQERDEREAEVKRQQELKMALEEQEKQRRIEEGHESRRLTREQRLRERETKRILHEQELVRLEEDSQRVSSQEPNESNPEGSKRVSSRQLQSQREQHKIELERLAEEESKWIFDCAVCGVHGENLDDGTHSIACDRCNVWQHSKCYGLTKQQAEREDFHFICTPCKQKEEDAKKPKIPALKLGKGESPKATQKTTEKPTEKSAPATNGQSNGGGLPDYVRIQLDGIDAIQQPMQKGNPYPPVGYFGVGAAPKPPPAWNTSPNRGNAHRQPQTSREVPPESSMPYQAQSHPYPAQHQPYQSSRPQSHGYQPGPLQSQPYQPGGQVRQAQPSGNQPYQPSRRPSQQQQQQQHPPYTAYQSPPAQLPYQQPPYGQQSRQAMSPTNSHPMHLAPAASHSPHATYDPGSRSQQPALQPAPMLSQPQGPGNGMWASGRGSHEAMAGAASPSKTSARPPSSHQELPVHSSPRLQHSPQTHLPPPMAAGQAPSASSPTKMSSSPHQPPLTSPLPKPNLITTPQQSLRMADSDSHSSHAYAVPPNSSSKLAADGMSGPWPANTHAIPQKRDASSTQPPPLSSSSAAGSPSSSSSAAAAAATSITRLPPVASLVPSPRQQAAAQTGTIPVKKSVEHTNGLLGRQEYGA